MIEMGRCGFSTLAHNNRVNVLRIYDRPEFAAKEQVTNIGNHMKREIKTGLLLAAVITALVYFYIRGYNQGFEDAKQIEQYRIIKPQNSAKI